ncbi:hypothetical protein SRHO_G00276650 [Serrasalmus rhombeus]
MSSVLEKNNGIPTASSPPDSSTMHLTSRQIICLCYGVVLLSTCAFGGDDKVTTCCPSTSPGRFRGRIEKCAYVPVKGPCVEAYVFRTENGRIHCISVDAKWINATLKTLEKRGSPCKATEKKMN